MFYLQVQCTIQEYALHGCFQKFDAPFQANLCTQLPPLDREPSCHAEHCTLTPLFSKWKKKIEQYRSFYNS